MSEPKCRMGVYCSEHNFIHGEEAAELRERFESLLGELTQATNDGSGDADDIAREMREILDDVDARDSLPALERRKPHEPSTLMQVTESTPIGSCVLVIEDDLAMSFRSGNLTGRLTKTWTRSEPWKLGHGELVVSLVGRTGGYIASRCFVLENAHV
jgi:hypothetical protein